MALSAIVLLCLLALGSAAPRHDTLSRNRRETNLDTIMSEICTLSQGQGNKQLASLVAQATEHFRNLPVNSMPMVNVLNKIRAGDFCADYSKLESLFLDAVAFVGTPEALNVMALEIAQGRATGGRLGLYTVALNLLTQPNLEQVAALTPIFLMENSYQLVSLAASTVVNRYCNTCCEECDQAQPVIHILNQLSNKLKTQCTPDFSQQNTLQVLTTLKSVGNIGQVSPDMFEDVMKCASTEGIEINVRFAALMSLKGALKGTQCNKQFTKTLVAKAVEGSTNKFTEVRIGSYLAAVRCAEAEDFETVIKAMANERNEQVKGFILSHIENLQETNWPLKHTLREIVESKDIPYYMKNIFTYSRNVELSANSQALGVGGLIEANSIYTEPQTYVPRLVNLGLNMNLLGSFINIGEVGARLEGFEHLNQYINAMANIFQMPLSSIIEELKMFMNYNGKEILQQIQNLVKENKLNSDSIIKALDKMIQNSKNFNKETLLIAFNEVLKNAENIDINSILQMVDFDSVVKFIRNFVNNNKFQLPKIDLYTILRAQERAFLSFGGEKHQFTIKQLFESAIPFIVNALSSAQNLNVDTSRMGQFNIDYTLPSINGKPLRFRLKGTGVAGIQLKNNLNLKSGAVDALLKIIPSFSGQIEGQMSYGENESTKLRGNLYTTNGFSLNFVQKGKDVELQIDLPEKMELINIEIESDKTPDKDVRMKDNQCIGIVESVTGLLVCYEIKVPDLMKYNQAPLGNPLVFRVYFEKSDPAMKGYRLAAKLKNKPTDKMLKIAAGTYGATDSKESSLILSYTKEQDTYLWSTKFKSSSIKSVSELTFINQPEYKSLQYYCSDKIGSGIDVEGSVKIDFQASSVNIGKTYEVAVYTGFAKELTEKNRLFQVIFSLLEYGDKTTAKFLTKTDLLPVTFEAGIDFPSNAGLRIYKVEGLTLRSTVAFMEVEALFRKKSSEVYETILNFKKSGTVFTTFSVTNTISIESPLTGFEAFKLKLKTKAKAKFPNTEFEFNAKLTYENGVMDTVTQVRFNDSGISTIKSSLSYTETGIELSTKASCLDAMCFSSNILHNLDITATVMEIRIGIPAADSNLVSRWSYVDGLVGASTEVTFLDSVVFSSSFKQSFNEFPITSKAMVEVPSVFLFDISHTIDSTGLSTEIEIKAPRIIKPLRINNVLVITDIFSYSFLSEILNADEVALRVEGPMTIDFSSGLQEKLDLEISGAFDGTFNIKQECTISLEKSQYIFNARHKNTKIVLFDLTSELTKPGEITATGELQIPFVVNSNQKITLAISEEYMYLYIFGDTLALPDTDFSFKDKGYIEIRLSENKFDLTHEFGIFDWDDNTGEDRIVGHKGKYTLIWPQIEFQVKGDIWVSTLRYVYKLESNLASPLEWFQGNSGWEMTITKYTPDISNYELAVIKNMVDIQYTDSQVTITPSFTIRTDFENNFELDEKFAVSSSLVAKRLSDFLNFDVVYEATVTAAQLQPITLVSKLSHEDKDQSGKLLFRVTLKESFLNEECSFLYVLESKPALFNRKIRLQYGPKVVKLTTEIVPPQYERSPFLGLPVNTGEPFGITYELSLPLQNVKSLKAKLSAESGEISLTLLKNDKEVVKIYYKKPTMGNYFASIFVNHRVGIQSTSRTVEFKSRLTEDNTLLFTFWSNVIGDSAFQASLRISKARTVKFEASLGAIWLPKRLTFAVELELYDNTEDKADRLSVSVDYDVSGAPKLLNAALNELQGIYEDFVSDGLLPDVNKVYKISQNMLKQLPGVTYFIQDQLTVMLTNLYYYCYNSLSNVYLLYEADLYALWTTMQSDVPMYLNTMKTKVPAFFKEYMEIIKNTETWKAMQTTLNEIMVDYTAFYDYILEFYNKVVVKYLTNLSKSVSKLLVLSKSDVNEYLNIVEKEVSTIFKNVVSQFKKTKLFRLLKEKYYELSSKVVQYLKKVYPAVLANSQDLYEKVIVPTSNDIYKFIASIMGGIMGSPLDFHYHAELIKEELQIIVVYFVNNVLETQIVKDLKTAYPNVFEVTIDFNNKVILPTYEDVDAIVRALISIPISDNLALSWQTVDVLKTIPEVFAKFSQRVSTTQLVTELKTLLPTFSLLTEDFYKVVLLPTAQDIKAFLIENFSVSLGDIYEQPDKYWELIKVEVPSIIAKFIQRITNTQAINMLRTNFDQIKLVVQNKFEELKTQYPELYAVGLDFYTEVVKPAIDDISTLYNKLSGITDQNQLRDFVTNDVDRFMKQMINRIRSTQLYRKFLPVFYQWADANLPLVLLYNDIMRLNARDVIPAIESYLYDNFSLEVIMGLGLSRGRFSVVFPLPVKAETVRNTMPFVLDFIESSQDYAFTVYRYFLFMGRRIYEYIGFQLINYRPYLEEALEFVKELPLTITKMVDDFMDSLPEDEDEFFDPLEEMIENFLSTPYGEVTEQIAEKLFELFMTTYTELSERYPKEAQAFNDFLNLCMEKLEVFIEFLMFRIINIMVTVEVYQDLYEVFVEEYVDTTISGFVDHPLVQNMNNYISSLTIDKIQFDLRSVFLFAMQSIDDIMSSLPKEVIAFITLHVPNFVFEYMNLGFLMFFILISI